MSSSDSKPLSLRLLHVVLIALLIVIVSYFMFVAYTLILDPDSIRIFYKGDRRFIYGVDSIGKYMSRARVDRILPDSMFDRVEFPLSEGGTVVVVFRYGRNQDLQKAISEMPNSIESYEQLTPLKEGFIISFGTFSERSGYDWVDGTEWKGFKEGVLREQLDPEQIPPNWRP